MNNIKGKTVLLASAALAGTIGLGGVVAAHASTPNGSTAPSVSSSTLSGTAQSAEGTETESPSDGPNQGPDTNANEPGHQDADNGTTD